MKKTLREELEDAFDIARIEGMLHSKDGKHSLSSEADAEGIIEFISQRIKATALTDEQGTISCYKIKDASFHNWMGLALAVRNNGISDFPLCNKSFNLSYSGHDL